MGLEDVPIAFIFRTFHEGGSVSRTVKKHPYIYPKGSKTLRVWTQPVCLGLGLTSVGLFGPKQNIAASPAGCLETLTGGFWTPVVTRNHLLEDPGIYTRAQCMMVVRLQTSAPKAVIILKTDCDCYWDTPDCDCYMVWRPPSGEHGTGRMGRNCLA